MNRQQFLSELSQYLTFVSSDERAAVMEEYSSRFDEAGADGEASLILQLGTPMMIAIALKRRKEAGEPLTEKPFAPKADPATEQRFAEINRREPATVPTEEAASLAEAEATDDGTRVSPEELSNNLDTQEEAETDGEADESCDEQPGGQNEKLRPGAGAVISFALLSLLAAVLGLAVIAVGTYFLIVMGNLFVVAFGSLHILSDALLLFAGALVSGGVGLVIVWLGLWTAIRIISGRAARLRAD